MAGGSRGLARTGPRPLGRNQRSAPCDSPTDNDGEEPSEFASATLCHLDLLYNLARKTQRNEAPAPDLEALRLTHTAAATGDLDGQPATAHAYRDPAGQRLTIYISDRSFPVPHDAHQPAGPTGPWTIAQQGVTVRCASTPQELLVVGEDQQLVNAAADALDVT